MTETMRQFLDFLTVAEFAQAVLLIFILFVMDKNRKANIFFAGFLIILSSNFFLFYLFKSDIKCASFIFGLLALPGISVTGVFIYLYVLFMTGMIDRIKLKHCLHFIVYSFSLFFFIVTVYNLKGDYKDSATFRQSMFILISIGFINSISYIIYTIAILKKYYNKIENYYSDLEKISLRWLLRISSLSFFILAFWCITFWFSHLGIIPRSPVSIAGNLIMLIITIFITAYHLINQPEIFRKNIEMNQTIEDSEDSSASEKYARQSIDENMQDEYLAKVSSFMIEKKPYLEESITIKDLAEEINIPPHHLSIVINNRLNKNFYTFINEYRIKEAVSILDDPENSDASIIAIAFRSGFNSKSTFNSVFKKITGLTPSEYRSRETSESILAS